MATLTFLATAVVLILEMVQPQSRVLVELHKLSDSLPGGLHPSMWLALAAGGLWFLARPSPSTSIGRSKGPSPRSTSPSEDRNSAHPPPANPADDSDWKEQVLEAIDAMTLETGVSLHVDRSQGVPFTLILDRCTPGRSRRSLSSLGKFLSQVPRPPRVSILFQNCEKPNIPWQHLVSGALSPHLGRHGATVVALSDRVDLIFSDFDSCYTQETV